MWGGEIVKEGEKERGWDEICSSIEMCLKCIVK